MNGAYLPGITAKHEWPKFLAEWVSWPRGVRSDPEIGSWIGPSSQNYGT